VTLARLLALTLASAVAVSCAPDGGPVEIPEDQLPPALSGSPEPFPDGGAAAAQVFFVLDGRVERVVREIPTEAPVVEGVVRALLEGPSQDERSRGIETAIPGATQLLGVRVLGGVAHVDLSDEFQGPAEPTVVLLRVAQVVWTLASVPGVVAVSFAIEGEAIGVPTEGRAVVEGPVSALDYASAAPAS
jgi:hypothetical protein